MLKHTDFVHFENGATKSEQKETIGQFDRTILEMPNEKTICLKIVIVQIIIERKTK